MKITSVTANNTDGLAPNRLHDPFLLLVPEQLLDVFMVQLPLVVRVRSHPAEMKTIKQKEL